MSRRWVSGRYGLPEGVAVEELATAIDAVASACAETSAVWQSIQQPPSRP